MGSAVCENLKTMLR